MTLSRRVFFAPLFFLALGFASPVNAAETAKKPAWETDRTSSPETLEELKALQARVKELAKKASNSTVALLVGQGAGSGVIVSEDGLVLTAAHVIGKPRQPIVFVLTDGTTVKGESLGINTNSDSGMARITEKPPKNATWPGAKDGKWPVMEMGKSAKLPVGQWVVSMGHPGGPKPDRPPPVRLGRFRSENKFLSTDCTLVGGDSGGPLFDLDGKVIGIHSQIGFTLEMNMHVPMDKFKTDWDRLVRGDSVGKRTDAEMGLVFDDKDKPKEGVKVAEIVENGPAFKAKFEEGDVITKFGTAKVKTASDFPEILSSYTAGDKVKVTVLRDGEMMTLTMTLGKKSSKKQ
jgi:serine protease Do